MVACDVHSGLLVGSEESMAVQTAVRYEIEKHNNSTSTVFRLDRYEKSVDAADSFDVCKACTYSACCVYMIILVGRHRDS